MLLLLILFINGWWPSISSSQKSLGKQWYPYLFCLSSRELKCQCEYYDDQTIGQEYFSEIISKSVDTEPQGNPKVSHVILKNCEMIDIVLDLDNLDRNRFQVTDVSFMDVPTLNIMFRYGIHIWTKLSTYKKVNCQVKR